MGDPSIGAFISSFRASNPNIVSPTTVGKGDLPDSISSKIDKTQACPLSLLLANRYLLRTQ